MLKILIGMYILVSIKEAIDFKLTCWEGYDRTVESVALVLVSLFWPPIFVLWILVKGRKMFQPSPSPDQYQMFAKEK